MTDFRKVSDNLDEFNDLVQSFTEGRKKLKQKLKENRGNIVTRRFDGKPLTKEEVKQQPTIEAINRLGKRIEPNAFMKMFKEYTSTSKTQSEIKLSTTPDEGRLGTNGRVNLPDLDDGVIRVNNVQTGESIEHKLDGDLAELLIKPYRELDLDEISDTALRKYFEILKVAGISSRANNNRKIQAGKRVYGRVNASASPPGTPPRRPRDSDDEPAGRGDDERVSPPAYQRRRYNLRTRGMAPKKKTGRGYLMDINDMVGRLDLLANAQRGGNVSNQLKEEMMEILDALLNHGAISKAQHKRLFKKYI